MDYVLGLTKVRKEMHNENRINQEIIGLNFKNLRLKNNLTQKELASFLNTTQSVISAYENGKTLILTSFALQICLKYKASLDELCNRK